MHSQGMGVFVSVGAMVGAGVSVGGWVLVLVCVGRLVMVGVRVGRVVDVDVLVKVGLGVWVAVGMMIRAVMRQAARAINPVQDAIIMIRAIIGVASFFLGIFISFLFRTSVLCVELWYG